MIVRVEAPLKNGEILDIDSEGWIYQKIPTDIEIKPSDELEIISPF